jgi:hypothetical protein
MSSPWLNAALVAARALRAPCNVGSAIVSIPAITRVQFDLLERAKCDLGFQPVDLGGNALVTFPMSAPA